MVIVFIYCLHNSAFYVPATMCTTSRTHFMHPHGYDYPIGPHLTSCEQLCSTEDVIKSKAAAKTHMYRDRGIMRLCARIILGIIGDLPHNWANPA